MSELPSAASLHADGQFAAAAARTAEALGRLSPDDPATPSLIAELALRHERQGMHETAIQAAEMAVSWSWEQNTSADYAEQRNARQPSLLVNVFKVYARAAARARLAVTDDTPRALRNKAEAYRVHAAASRGAALSGIREQRSLPRAHQWGINVLATSAVDRAASAEGLRRRRELRWAMGQAVGSIALGTLSESPWFVHHTTPDRSFFGRWLRDKPKAVLRGGAAVVGVALSVPDRPMLNRARDRLTLRIF